MKTGQSSPEPINITKNEELRGLNTLRLPCIAQRFCRAGDEAALLEALDYARTHDLQFHLLGGGSNVVLPDFLPGLTVLMDLQGIRIQSHCITVGAGETWHDLVLESLQHGLHGIENLSLIPGTVGAAPVQNIGAYGQELSQVFLALRALDTMEGNIRTFSRTDCEFGYRTSLFRKSPGRFAITSVTLQLNTCFVPVLNYPGVVDELENRPMPDGDKLPSALEVSAAICRIRQRKLPDPAQSPNAGSFFKNPVISYDRYRKLQALNDGIAATSQPDGMMKLSAARLIELAGMQSCRVGDAMVSARHSLVLVNEGNATSSDILNLAARIRSRVSELFGIQLEIEPIMIMGSE